MEKKINLKKNIINNNKNGKKINMIKIIEHNKQLNKYKNKIINYKFIILILV